MSINAVALEELLSNPPGSAVKVNSQDESINLRFTIRIPIFWRTFLLSLAAVLFVMGAVIVGYWQLKANGDLPVPIGTTILLWGAGIGCCSAAVCCGVLVLLVPLLSSEVTLTAEAIETKRMNSIICVPWSDIESVIAINSQKREYVVKATQGGWPLMHGVKYTAVAVTDGGKVRLLQDWQESASKWLVSVIHAYRAIGHTETYTPGMNLESEARDRKQNKQTKGQFVVLGFLLSAISVPFAYHSVTVLSEALSVGGWVQVTGEIKHIDRVQTDDAKPTIEVEYSYSVDGVAFSGDRYGFGSSHSSADERSKRAFEIGEKLQVWYDPAHPDHSVLNPRFPWSEVFLGSVCVGSSLGGIGLAILAMYGPARWLNEPYVKNSR